MATGKSALFRAKATAFPQYIYILIDDNNPCQAIIKIILNYFNMVSFYHDNQISGSLFSFAESSSS